MPVQTRSMTLRNELIEPLPRRIVRKTSKTEPSNFLANFLILTITIIIGSIGIYWLQNNLHASHLIISTFFPNISPTLHFVLMIVNASVITYIILYAIHLPLQLLIEN